MMLFLVIIRHTLGWVDMCTGHWESMHLTLAELVCIQVAFAEWLRQTKEVAEKTTFRSGDHAADLM